MYALDLVRPTGAETVVASAPDLMAIYADPQAPIFSPTDTQTGRIEASLPPRPLELDKLTRINPGSVDPSRSPPESSTRSARTSSWLDVG